MKNDDTVQILLGVRYNLITDYGRMIKFSITLLWMLYFLIPSAVFSHAKYVRFIVILKILCLYNSLAFYMLDIYIS